MWLRVSRALPSSERRHVQLLPISPGDLTASLISAACFAQEVKPAPAPAAVPQAAPAPEPAAAPAPAPAPAAEAAPAPEKAAGKTEPAQDFARIVCFREKKFAGSFLHHTVHMDGKDVADLNNGTYFVIKVAPGEHTFYADEEKDLFKMKVDAGKTYYFRSEIVMGLWKGHGRIVALEEGTGAKAFEDLKAKLAYSPELRDPSVLEVPGAAPAPAATTASVPAAAPAPAPAPAAASPAPATPAPAAASTAPSTAK